MQWEYDEKRWPELAAFRKACFRDDFAKMGEIAASGHDWYENENPTGLPFEKLADIFRAQTFASEGDLPALRELIESESWLVNEPWTAQKWRPLSQAIQGNHEQVVGYLLSKGADPLAVIGGPGEEETSIKVFANSEYCDSESIRKMIREAVYSKG